MPFAMAVRCSVRCARDVTGRTRAGTGDPDLTACGRRASPTTASSKPSGRACPAARCPAPTRRACLTARSGRFSRTCARWPGRLHRRPSPGHPRMASGSSRKRAARVTWSTAAAENWVPTCRASGRDVHAPRSRRKSGRPSDNIRPGYEPVTLVLRDGQRIRAVKKNEDEFSIQVMDMRQRVQGYAKANLTEVVADKQSVMPAYGPDPAERGDLDDLVSYLSTLRGPDSVRR